MNKLIQEAKTILRQNDQGRYTVPSKKLYPHMWAWDSVFASMGWAHIDIARAQTELEAHLDTAWENGMIPHIVFNQKYIA
ncbi:MAG: MGH1-like glycoside hydrolase domain-containing protein, partial [Bacteriovoracaceae bacterium]